MSMSYASYDIKSHIMTNDAYDIKCHIMTNDAYDIKIWHKAIWNFRVTNLSLQVLVSIHMRLPCKLRSPKGWCCLPKWDCLSTSVLSPQTEGQNRSELSALGNIGHYFHVWLSNTIDCSVLMHIGQKERTQV